MIPLFLLSSLLTAFSFSIMWFHGYAIEALVVKSMDTRNAIMLVTAYGMVHWGMGPLGSLKEYLKQSVMLGSYKATWQKYIQRVNSYESRSKANRVFHAITTDLPSALEMRINNKLEILALVFLGITIGYKIVADGFYVLLPVLLAIFFLGLLSHRILEKTYHSTLEQSFNDRNQLSTWFTSFFKGVRERVVNYSSGLDGRAERLNNSAGIKKAMSAIQFKRGLWQSFLIDAPYVLIVCYLFYLLFLGRLGVADFIVWMGLSERFIRVASTSRKIAESSMRAKHLETEAHSILQSVWIEDPENQKSPNQPLASLPYSVECAFADRTTSHFNISKNGIEFLQGANGVGKTTALYELLNLTHTKYQSSDSFSQAKVALEGQAWVIERDPWMSGSPTFLGELLIGTQLESLNDAAEALSKRLESLGLGGDVGRWMTQFQLLNTKYSHTKIHGEFKLSSGESIMLSLFRFLIGPSHLRRIIIVDEADAFLDKTNKSLFIKLMSALSAHYKVLWISHSVTTRDNYESLVESAHLFGVQNGKGTYLQLQLSVRQAGSGAVIATQTWLEPFTSELKVVRSALMHNFPEFKKMQDWDFMIDSANSKIPLGNITSGRLSLAVALISLFRVSRGRSSLGKIAASGLVLLDGSIDPVSGIEAKRKKAQEMGFGDIFLDSAQTPSLRDLPAVLKQSMIVNN